MKRLILGLVACVMMTLGQAALASPEVDARVVAAAMVRNDRFEQVMRDRMAAAAAGKLSHALSQRGVKLRDADRLMAVMPDLYSTEVADRIEGTLTRGLLEKLTPEDLSLLAGYYLQVSVDPSLAERRVVEVDPDATLAEQLHLATDEMKAMATPLERAKMSAGFQLLGIIVAEQYRPQPDLGGADVAEIMAERGVFEFPNRIIRQELIREFRAAAPQG